MRLKWLLPLTLGAGSLIVANAALADTFSYDYSGTDGTRTYVFDFTSPTLITSTDIISPSCTITGGAFPATCNGVTLAVPDNEILIDYTETIGGIMVHPTFADQGTSALFTVGTHATADGSLTITDVPSAATPEPSGMVLLGTGLLTLAGMGRRRFFS